MAGIEGFKGQEQKEGQSGVKKKKEYVGVDSSKFYPEEESADAQLQADLQGLDDSDDKDSTNVAEKEENIENLIKPEVDDIVKEYKDKIKDAAVEFGVDKYIIAAIIYNEQRLLGKHESVIDSFLAPRSTKVSLGLGQVQSATALLVEQKNYITLPPSEKASGSLDREYRIKRLENPKWNIRYVGAYLEYIQDVRKGQFPAIKNRPDILATCYNLGKDKPEDPHSRPESNKYGKQVQSLYRHVQTLV